MTAASRIARPTLASVSASVVAPASTAVAAVAAVLLGSAAPVAAQDMMPYCEAGRFAWGVGPTLVPADGFWTRFGARAEAAFCTAGHDDRRGFPLSYGINIGGQYLLVDESVEIPDATEIRATGALSMSIYEPEEEAPEDLHPDSLPTFDGGGFDLGFVELGPTAAYQANANRDVQLLALGGEARYANNAPGWGTLVPSLVVRYEWVEPTAFDAGEPGAPDTDDAHSRLTVRGYLNLRPEYVWSALGDFRIQIDASLFRAEGLEEVLAAAGWESGEYLSVTLRYARRVPVWVLAITSVYGQYAAGQLPTDFDDREAFSAGISLTIGR